MLTAVRFPAFVSVSLAVLATAAAALVALLSGGWCDQALGLKGSVGVREFQVVGEARNYSVKLPPARRGFAYAADETMLSEDGRELVRLAKGVRAQEMAGCFRHKLNTNPESVVFRPADGSDPRENGHAYKLSVRQTPSLWLLGCLGSLAVGGWFFAGCRAPAGATGESAPASQPSLRIPVFIFLVALSIRLIFLWFNPLYSDGLFAIQGVPFSDAKGWNLLAQSLIDGHGLNRDGWWSPKRPLFSICLALVYTWTGDSLTAAKCFLAVVTAGTAAIVFLVFRRAAPHWVAVAAGLFIALDRREIESVAVLLTEPVGIFFAAASVWALIVALQEKKGRWLFAAGALFACSNLARPLTLPGFPLLVALIAGHSFLTDRGRWRALFGRCALFAAGVFICLMPWLVRQRVVHGIWAVSDNTASALFAASSPEFRVWSGKVEDEATKANAEGDMIWRYRYFNRRFQENLKESPGYYFSHILECLPTAVWQSNLPNLGHPLGVFGAAAVAATGLAGAVARRRRDESGRRFLFLAGLLTLAVLVSGVGVPIVATVGLVWCFRANPAAASVLALTFASAALAAALFGNTALDRTRSLLEWMEVGWFFAGLYGIAGMTVADFHHVSSLPARTADVANDPPGPRARRPWLISAVGLGAGLLLISAARLIWRTIHPPPAVPAVVLSTKDRTLLMREMAARYPALKALDAPDLLGLPRDWKGRLFIEPVHLEKEAYWFPKPPEVKPRPGFGTRFPLRDHPYTSFTCKAEQPPMSYEYEVVGLFASPLPASFRGQVCLAIGLIPQEPDPSRQAPRTVEILALVPGPKVKRQAIEKAVVAQWTPETQRLIETLSPAAPPSLPPK